MSIKPDHFQSSGGLAPMIAITGGPAQDSTIQSSSASFTFAALRAAAVWCVPDSGVRERCDSGSYTASSLAAGTHMVTFVAIGAGNTPAALISRRFQVAPANNPVISSYASPAPDTLTISGVSLSAADELRLATADGQQIVYALPDARVQFAAGAQDTFTITDVNVGRETITQVQALQAGQVRASASGSVEVASSITLVDAASPSASTLVIDGTHMTAVDRITLLHAGGSLSVGLGDPGVIVSDTQVIITSEALGGLRVSQIDAIRLVDGVEVMASLSVDITIESSDTTPPVIQTPGDLTREATGPDGAIVTYEASATDARDGDVAVTCAPASGSQFSLGDTQVSCGAQDAAGNQASDTFVVSVVDTTGPVISVPDPIVVETSDPDGADVTYEASAADAVDGPVAHSCSPGSGSRFQVGVTTVLCESTDSRGNTSARTFTITVRDVAAPVLSWESPDLFFVSDTAGEAIDFEVTATDAVDGPVPVVCEPSSGDVFEPGTYAIRCEAVDASGNSGVLDRTIEVRFVDARARAESAFAEVFPEVLAERYQSNLPMGVQTGQPSPGVVTMNVVDAAGVTHRAWAEGDFGYVDSAGDVRGYDTSLQVRGGGWSPASVAYDATLPTYFGEGIRWAVPGVGAIRFVPVSPRVSEGAVRASGDQVLYPNVWPSTDALAIALQRGIKEHFLVRSASGTQAVRWRFEGPSGATLRVDEGELWLDEVGGSSERVSERPVVKDAQQRIVAARYELSTDSAGATIVALVWETRVDDEDGSTRSLAYPLDVDPSYVYPAPVAPAQSDPSGRSPDGRIANCWDGRFEEVFAAGRTFSSGARITCTLPGPPVGASWFSFAGQVTWWMTNRQRLTIHDGDALNSPTGSTGVRLASYNNGKSVVTYGSTDLRWDEAQGIGAPEGSVTLRLNTLASPQPLNANRAARINYLTRTFYDDDAPEILDMQPGDDRVLSAGARTISMTAQDLGFGCRGAQGSFSITRDLSLVQSGSFPGCSFAQVLNLESGAYRVQFTVRDGLGNQVDAAESGFSFVVADPLADPDPGATVGGIVPIELQLAEELEAGPVTVRVRLASGQLVQIAAVDRAQTDGIVDLTWDSRAIRNQDVTIELLLGEGAGARMLDSSAVRVLNVDPLAMSADAASRQVGGGMAVVLATGALQGTRDDVRVPGYGGVELGVSRTYNSLNDVGGVFGPGFASNLDQRLVIGVEGRVIMDDALGLHHQFDETDGVYGPSPSFSGRLLANQDAATSAQEPWIVRFPDGRELRYAPADSLGVARISRETWPAGEFVRYERSAPDASGRSIWTVRDATTPAHTVAAFVNAAGRVEQVMDPASRETRYTYDELGRLSTIEDPAGGTTRLGWEDESERIVSITDPVDSTWQVSYDSNVTAADVDAPRVEQATWPQHIATEPATSIDFDYDTTPGTVTSTEGDRETSVQLTASGLAAVETDAEGQTTSYTYNDLGLLTSTVDAEGAQTSTVYNGVGQVLVERDGNGNETRYEDLDVHGVPRRTIDAAGKVWEQTLDAAGRVITRTGPDGNTWSWEYQPNSALKTQETNPAGDVTRYTYAPTGQLATEYWLDDDGASHYRTTKTYDVSGRLESSSIGNDPAATFEYDAMGRQISSTDAAGATSSQTWDLAGRVLTSTDALGKTTTNEYDAVGNLVKVTDPTSAVTRFEFDSHGDQVAMVDAAGRRSQMTYDGVGNQLTETDAASNTTRYEYDGVGNQTLEVDPDGRSTQSTFDGEGNETSTTTVDGTTYTTYTALGEVETETDEQQRVTTYVYDDMGREVSVIDPRGYATETHYDQAGRVSYEYSKTGMLTSYAYDRGGRKVLTVNPDLTTAVSVFDDSDRATQVTDRRGGVTQIDYDDAGRKLHETRPDGSDWSWSYDLAGRQLSATNGEGETTSQTYDDAGRVATTTSASNATTSRSYYPDGRLWKVTLPTGGVQTHTYDPSGRVDTVTDEVGNVTQTKYDGVGNPTLRTRGSDTWTWQYDDRGRERTATRGASRHLKTYNELGQLTRRESVEEGMVDQYTYDENGLEATRYRTLGQATLRQYDGEGRMTVEDSAAGRRSWFRDYQTGRLNQRYDTYGFGQSASTFYSYDAGGSVASIEQEAGTELTGRDTSDRVVSHTSLAGRTTTTDYDGAGRVRAQQVETTSGDTVTRQWGRDDAGRLTTLDTGTGQIQYSYTADDLIAAKIYPGGRAETFTYDAKRRLASRQLAGEAAYLYEYDALDRIVTIRRAEVIGGLSWVEDRYGYDNTGRLVNWWHDRDQIRTEYEYSYSQLQSVRRYVEQDPGGENTPEQADAIRICQIDITSSDCDPQIADALRRFGTAYPAGYDAASLSDADLQVARYAFEQGVRLEYNNIYYRDTWPQDLGYAYLRTRRSDLMRQPLNDGDIIEYDQSNYDYVASISRVPSGDQRQYTYSRGQIAIESEGGSSQSFVYDNDQRLIRVDYPDGRPSLKIDYDQQDRIISIDRDATTEGDLDLIWDEQGLAAIHENGTSPRTLYPIYNQRGDVTQWLDQTGQTISTTKYTPWGIPNTDGETVAAGIFGYQGRYASLTLNAEHVWMRARTYNPELGQFLEVDPEPAQDGTADTAYSYASNDPINQVDPDGMRTKSTYWFRWRWEDPAQIDVNWVQLKATWIWGDNGVESLSCEEEYYSYEGFNFIDGTIFDSKWKLNYLRGFTQTQTANIRGECYIKKAKFENYDAFRGCPATPRSRTYYSRLFIRVFGGGLFVQGGSRSKQGPKGHLGKYGPSTCIGRLSKDESNGYTQEDV